MPVLYQSHFLCNRKSVNSNNESVFFHIIHRMKVKVLEVCFVKDEIFDIENATVN